MEKFKAVLDLQIKHRSALGYGLVTLLTAGGEKIFSTVVFQCPCTATLNLTYGLVFLLVPALALFLLGYALSARTWRLLTGCCSRSASTRSSSGLRSTLVCAQVLGWVLIAAVIFLLLVFKCVSRCFSPVSYLQLKFWEIYLEKEKQILQSQAAEHATQLARENIRSFFECSKPKECNTPSRKDWQQISALYTFNSKNQFYSMLHKYVSRKEVSSSLHSVEGDVVVPVLGFVDDAAMANTHGV
ncbi:calcium homeostasis modulator protein 6 isoform X1 [Rattus norvegicus]|uniref:calcium homeostasis modulator protein 6 isoform X1 n=1 Tax=Rattus norvegicus TaxID=10116 RepID=UPI000050847F|nr:calcium homeostasis modulator protein 6 isoform X1 [Rattus norvegicus]|eukprot:XP_008771102.1 PREDICTED: protein FAM26F isoform X1 [Rattus norvegicus]